MANQSNYQRSGNRSFHSLASPSSTDQGQMYTRDMGPPSADYLPRPIEIDLNMVNSSRTLPNPSISASMQWDSFSSQGFGDVPYGVPTIPRMPSNQNDGHSRGPSDNPLVQWYSANDGPWNPIPKSGIESAVDDRLLPKQTSNRNVSYSGQYRQLNPSDDSNFHYGVPNSDSGYGTRPSVGNTSVFSADVHDRDQDSRSMVGPPPEFKFFNGYNEVLQQRDNAADSTRSPQTSHGSEPTGLICPSCLKPVKTRSELKKHDLRHRKPYLCRVPGCLRTEGFSTTNDLERHTKTKHPSEIPENTSIKKFRCLVPGCKSRDKAWPRLDNFRSHLKRVHANYLSSDEEIDEMIRRGEFWERTGITLESEVTIQRDDLPGAVRLAHPVQDTLPRQPDLKAQYPEVMDYSQDLTASSGPQSEFFGSNTASPEDEPPQSEEPLPATVQPVKVVFRAPAQMPKSRMTLDKVLSSTNIDPSLEENEQAKPHLSATFGPQGKAPRQTVPATDAVLTAVIQKALAGANVSDSSTDRNRNQDPERCSLPGRKLSSTESLATSPSPALSDPRPLDLTKPTDRPSEDASTESDAQKQAVEVLKFIRNLGYTVSKETTQGPKIQNPGSAASKKSDHRVTCQICEKFTGRPCELKKHMKRHDRPYGCTFLTCNKYFGSKNDWKRHENSQHFHLETWRCDEERLEGGPCAKACYRRQTFQEHLKKEHKIEQSELVKKKIDACRIGRNCQARFWCGFCKKLVELNKKGLEAWTERFDHIDDHFMGRAPFSKQSIQDWNPVDSDKTKGELEMTKPETPVTLGSGSGSSPQDAAEGSPSGNGSSPGSDGQSSANPIVVEEDSYKSKRRASDDLNERPAKQPRSHVTFQILTYCCQCKGQHNPRFDKNCTICPDSHLFCDNCVTEREQTHNN